MNLRNLFRLFSVVHMIGGLVWLLAPKAMPASLYGLDIDSFTAFLFQQLGALNVAIAVLFFLVSGMAHSSARQAVVTFAVILQVMSAIAYIPALLNGAIPGTIGWFGIAFSLVGAMAFGYFRFIRPEASATPGLQS
jgi:hypothetical protein